MNRVAIIAKLRPGAEDRATELLESGPPFDPAQLGIERHTVFTSGDHAVFIFEGGRLDELLQSLVGSGEGSAALQGWEPLLDGVPRVAKEVYVWARAPELSEEWGE